MQRCHNSCSEMDPCRTITRRDSETTIDDYEDEAKCKKEAQFRDEARCKDDVNQSKGLRINLNGFSLEGNDHNHIWKTKQLPVAVKVDYPDKSRIRGPAPPVILGKGQLEIQISLCDNRNECKVLSKSSKTLKIELLSKPSSTMLSAPSCSCTKELERRTEENSCRVRCRACLENLQAPLKSFCRFPSTFPSIFTHSQSVLLCLILILSTFGPTIRQNPGEGSPIGGGLLFAEAYSSTYNPKDFSRNVSQLITGLMANYDKKIRPGYGGPPTTIKVNMNVRSMGPFSEKKEEYAMQLYMRQVWYDSRLRFNKTDLGRSTFSMNWMFADKIWKPDTFFINGKKSYAHAITAPNMFVRLQHDGQIYMSMRLTVRASCIMHLRKFPLDTQTCPLRLASYGYNAKDIMYEWDPTKLVTVDSDVSIAQYELVNITSSEAIVPVRRIEKISTLTVKFHLTRLTGFFMLQVYVPCILIVCSSWVGFWITKKDAPGRVCLGVNNVLCMTKLGFGGRDIFPLVSYATALDYFVLLCFWFTFATMIEYAAINYLQRYVVASLNVLIKRRAKLREEDDRVAKLAREGAGCIKVAPSIHSSILETFKVHLTAFPAGIRAADTSKPHKPNPKAKLLQALKLPITVVTPKVADEADTENIEITLDHSHDAHHHHHHPFHLPHHHEDATSPALSSDTESSGSLSPKPYTPKLLQRLAVLQRRLSSHDIHDDSLPGSQPSSPQPSVEGSPLPSRPPLPPTPGPTPPQGSSVSPPSGQESPSQTHSVLISEQETPQMSPRMSPLTTSVESGLPSPTITTTPPALVTSAEGPPGGPTGGPTGAAGESSQGGAAKPEGTVVKMETGGDQPPPPPPAQKHTVTVWQLLIKKKYLMKHMTPTFELPGEEDLLDRFSVIDLYSRRIFPSFFFILFTIYWVLFNYYITDEFPHEPRIPSDGLVN